MSRRKVAVSGEIKPKNDVYAWGSLNLGVHPFKVDDIFREPTKEILDRTVWEYVPFST